MPGSRTSGSLADVELALRSEEAVSAFTATEAENVIGQQVLSAVHASGAGTDRRRGRHRQPDEQLEQERHLPTSGGTPRPSSAAAAAAAADVASGAVKSFRRQTVPRHGGCETTFV